jgi:aldehyde:ferredoxin oxidoreductase
MPHGHTGKKLWVDLTAGRWRIETSAPDPDFIGGRGLNQRRLFDLQPDGKDGLDPQSPILLSAGPLVGTLVPGACRLAVDFRNLVTGGVGSANLGGHFAAEMKFAGFDQIVIQGRSPRPVYLLVTPEAVFLRDAAELWGLDTWETENRIKRLESDPRIKTLSIGPAGENGVRFACLIGDRGRAAGYGGSGAVFGAKRLKAIAVRGGLPVTVAHPEALLNELVRFNREVVEKSDFVKVHRGGGTLAAYLLPGENRPHAVGNMSGAFWANDSIAKVDRDAFDRRYLVRRHACFACPVYCSAVYRVGDLVCEGLQANSWRAFASNLGITDPEMVMRLHALANRNGMDGDHTSAVLAWAVECYQQGIIDAGDTGGLDLRWNDGATMLRLLEQIVTGTHLGAVLAKGLDAAAAEIGRGSRHLAVTAHGNALMEAAMRSHKAWALGVVTSSKGGGHLRGAPAVEARRIPPELSRAYFGIDDIQDPTAYENKGRLVTWYENYKGVVDMMGLCYLPSMWMELGLFTPEHIARFHHLVTGGDQDAAALMHAGARLQTLEHLFNIRHAGFGRRDARVPEKLARIPVDQGPFTGQRLDPERWEEMLDDYYTAHGYDPATGWPTTERLAQLGLERDGRRLVQAGICLPSTDAVGMMGKMKCR